MYGERLAVYIAIMVSSMLVGFAGGWKVQNWRFTSKIATIQAEYAKTREELADRAQRAEIKARQKEHDAQVAAETERINNREKVSAINRQLSVALNELRNRPERSTRTGSEMPGATPACSGVSGAELARGDGEFLVGYSADAAKVNAAVKHCEAQYEQVRALLMKE